MFNKKLKEKISDLERDLHYSKETIKRMEGTENQKQSIFCANCKHSISIEEEITFDNRWSGGSSGIKVNVRYACSLENPCGKFERYEDILATPQ